MQLSSLQEGGNSSICIWDREVLHVCLFGEYPEQETLSYRDFFVCLNSTRWGGKGEVFCWAFLVGWLVGFGLLFFIFWKQTFTWKCIKKKQEKSKMQLGHRSWIITCLSCIITLEIHPPDSRAMALYPQETNQLFQGNKRWREMETGSRYFATTSGSSSATVTTKCIINWT